MVGARRCFQQSCVVHVVRSSESGTVYGWGSKQLAGTDDRPVEILLWTYSFVLEVMCKYNAVVIFSYNSSFLDKPVKKWQKLSVLTIIFNVIFI